MKQTEKKKPKTFRTLIQRIHIGCKTTQNVSNNQPVRKKNEKQEGRSPFFFGR